MASQPTPMSRPEPAAVAGSETWSRRGGRRVELFIPIVHGGRTIPAIDIAPVKLDHVERWGTGKIAGSMALLAELAGLDQAVLREMTYPDVDRVLAAFMGMLPPAIRDSLDSVPQAPAAPMADDQPPDAEEPQDGGTGFGPDLGG